MKSETRSLVLMLIAGLATLAWAAQPETEAAKLLADYDGIPAVACVPDCGSGELVLELVRQSKMLVLGLEDDAEQLAAAKKLAYEAGVLGRRLYLQSGTVESIPFADNYVDLLVLADVTEKDLTDDARAEIMRVLAPIRGRVVLADKTIVKPELPGSDWWPHKLHGPNNNPVSEDTVFQFPPLLQYRAMPMYSTGHGASLSGNGISYEFNPWTYHDYFRANLCGRIFARNVYNGRILWEAMSPFKMLPNLTVVALTDNALLMASEERGRVLRLDPLTGKELPPIDVGGEDVRVRWLACQGGVLYLLLGSPAELKEPFTRWLRLPKGQEEQQTLFGKELLAWDLEAGRVLWRHEEPAVVDYRAVALHAGRLFFYSEQSRLACLNAADGKLQWENTDKGWLDKETRPKPAHHAFNARTSSMIVADGLVYLALQGGVGNDCVFDAGTGRLLGMPALGRGTFGNEPRKYMILDGSIIKGNSAYDPATGERTGEVPSPAGTYWCGRVTYAPGTGVLGHSSLNFKSVCAVGAWVAGGVLTYFPSIGDGGPCPGAAGFVSGAEILDRIQKQPEHPIVRGEAFGSIMGSGTGIPEGEWAAYRGNSGHQGSSPVSISAGAAVAWTAMPDHPFSYSTLYNNFVSTFDERPAPPICVGDRVFSAGSDGIVAARSLATGEELWSFCAGGPVMCSPAWSDGLLFVPGADGWIYALDAVSGRLAWKRRLAPLERRILMFDQLVSEWPVLSLVVEGETVYAAAGHNATEGVKTFALNAQSGDVVWSHFDEPARERFQSFPQPPDQPVQGIGGSMCMVNDRVWAAGYYSVPLCLDKANGTDHLAKLKDEYITGGRTFPGMRLHLYQRGRDMIRVDNRTVLAGGDLLENHSIRGREEPRERAVYRLYYCNGDGDWQLEPAPRTVLLSRIAPACDGELLVYAGPPTYEEKRGQVKATGDTRWATLGLSVWSIEDFRKEADAMQKSAFVVKKDDRVVSLNADFDFFSYDGALWQKPGLDVNAIALAANAVLVAHATGREFSTSQVSHTAAEARQPMTRYDGWRISAFSRDGRQALWQVDLPSEPLYNGIAIARDGSVIVALRDGSILCVRGE